MAFGGDVTAGGLVGMVAGGFIGAGIGNFSGVSGGALKNIGAELAFGIGKGAVTGGFGGGIGAAIDGRDIGQGFLQGAKYGAIAGGSLAGLNIMTMGAAYKLNRSYGDFGRNRPVYRRGHFLWPKSAGISLGRNLVTRLTGDNIYDEQLQAHETGHYYQQSKLGFARFYGKILSEYFKYGQYATYDRGGTLEFGAQVYSLNQLGYFWSNLHGVYINSENYNNYYPYVIQRIY